MAGAFLRSAGHHQPWIFSPALKLLGLRSNSCTPLGSPLNQLAVPGSMRKTSSRSLCCSTAQPTGSPTTIALMTRKASQRRRRRENKGKGIDAIRYSKLKMPCSRFSESGAGISDGRGEVANALATGIHRVPVSAHPHTQPASIPARSGRTRPWARPPGACSVLGSTTRLASGWHRQNPRPVASDAR